MLFYLWDTKSQADSCRQEIGILRPGKHLCYLSLYLPVSQPGSPVSLFIRPSEDLFFAIELLDTQKPCEVQIFWPCL